MLQVTAEGLVLTLYLGMPYDLWLIAWAVFADNTAARREAFRALYHLEIATIEVDMLPVEVVRPVDGFEAWWVEIVLWLLDPLAACLEGCPQSQRPVT